MRLFESIKGRKPIPEETREIGRLFKRADTLSWVNFFLVVLATAAMLATRFV